MLLDVKDISYNSKRLKYGNDAYVIVIRFELKVYVVILSMVQLINNWVEFRNKILKCKQNKELTISIWES
jgi:hypothetical protein